MLDRFNRTKATPRQIYDVINGIPEEKPLGSTTTAEEIIETLPEGVRRIVLKSPNKYLVFADEVRSALEAGFTADDLNRIDPSCITRKGYIIRGRLKSILEDN